MSDDKDWGDGGPPVIGDEPPPETTETPAVPTAALLAESPEEAQPGDVTVAVEPPTESFVVYGVEVTQEPRVVPPSMLASLRRSAAEAGVTLIEGTA